MGFDLVRIRSLMHTDEKEEFHCGANFTHNQQTPTPKTQAHAKGWRIHIRMGGIGMCVLNVCRWLGYAVVSSVCGVWGAIR